MCVSITNSHVSHVRCCKAEAKLKQKYADVGTDAGAVLDIYPIGALG